MAGAEETDAVTTSSSMAELGLLDHNERTEGLGKAAWQLEDAVSDRLVDDYPEDPEARELAFEVADAETRYRTAMVLMIALTMLETPTWCNTNDGFFDYLPAHVRCRVSGVSDDNLLLSDLPYIPPGWGIIFEVIIMMMICKKLVLEYKLQSNYFSPKKVQYVNLKVVAFGFVMLLIEFADVIVFGIYRTNFRIAFIARTGYICLLPAMRNLMRCITAVIPDFASIAVFLMGAIAFFSWIVVTIFDDLTDISDDGSPVNKGFDSFTHTLNSLFVAGSTDDFVGVFLTSYTVYRQSGLLWLLFLVIVQVLLLSLVLDTLVSAYQTYAESEEEAFVSKKVKGVLKAFDALVGATGEEKLSKASFLDFVREYSRSPRTRRIPLKTANLMFAVVDEDRDGVIDKQQFCRICGVMQYDFWTTKKDSFMKDANRRLWGSPKYKKLRTYVDEGSFDTLMNMILLVNLVLVVVETIFDLNKWTETPLMEHLELSFALIYVSEVGIKLCTWSWEHYWSLRSNQFDFFTTWTLLACSTVETLVSEGAGGSGLKRYMNILRLLRLLRIVKQLKRMPAVQFMVNTISQLVMRSKDILMFLGLVTFFFTMLSVQLWGGIFYVTNPALKETEYTESKYFVLNFNDFSCAFGVWVVMFLCEYVPAFSDAVWAASPWPYTWLVFPIFYVFSVSIVFELVKAFTIEVFLDLNAKRGTEVKEVDALEDIMEMLKKRGEMLHYRVIGDASANEKMMEALEELMENEEEGEEGESKEEEGE